MVSLCLVFLYLSETQFRILIVDGENSSFSRRVWGPWATVGLGLVIGVVSLVVQILTGAVAGAIVFVRNPQLTIPDVIQRLYTFLGLYTAIATILSAVICTGLIIIIIKVRKGISIRDYLGMKRITLKQILISLAAVVVLEIAVYVIDMRLGHIIDTRFLLDVYNTSVWPALLWFGIVVFGPVFEEAFFRGFMYQGLINSRLGITGTIFLTSLLWAALHVQYGAFEIAVIFASGILLGIIRYKTGSIWPPLLMHCFMNVLAMIGLATNVNSLIG